MIVEYIRYKVELDRSEPFAQAYQLASRALDQSEFCRGYELSQCTEDKRVFRAAYPGHPWRPDTQRDIVRQALSLFETAITPRTTVKASFLWKEDGAIRRTRYGRVDPANEEYLLKVSEERRRQQAMAKARRTCG